MKWGRESGDNMQQRTESEPKPGPLRQRISLYTWLYQASYWAHQQQLLYLCHLSVSDSLGEVFKCFGQKKITKLDTKPKQFIYEEH